MKQVFFVLENAEMRKIPIFAHFGHILMFTFRVILQMSRGNERPLMKGYF